MTVHSLHAAPTRTKPLEEANFQSKKARKKARKSLRGVVSNVVSDARLRHEEKAQFYRRLRLIKLRRRKIAIELSVLADMVAGLHREVLQVEDRMRSVDMGYLNTAKTMVKTAYSSSDAAADEFHSFSRARVWYAERMKSC